MKRFPLLFTTVVWTAFLTLFLVRRAAVTDPYDDLQFGDLEATALPKLETPRGPFRLRGRTLDEEGQPLADVLVELVREGSPEWTSPWATRSDQDGYFEVVRLPGGTFVAHLVAPRRPQARFVTEVPAEVSWQLGPERQLDNVLPPLTANDLTGSIMPPVGWTTDEHPIAGFQVVFVPAQGTDPLSGALERRAVTDETGAWTLLDVVHGPYDLYVLPPWAHGGDWPKLSEESRRHAGLDHPVSLRLRSGALDLELDDPNGAPLAGALVRVTPKDDPKRPWPFTQTDGDGKANVEHLPPGDYALNLRSGEREAQHTFSVRIGRRTRLELAL